MKNTTLDNVTRRNAREIKSYRRLMRIIPFCIVGIVAILLVSYLASLLYSKYGAFTVTVNQFDAMDYALTLSENKTFSSTTSRLNCDAAKKVTNIDGDTIPEGLDNLSGENNGTNYIAYTFYLKNEGKSSVAYSYNLYIANATQGIEKAVRIKFYLNHEATVYALPKTDGTVGPEDGTTEFYSSSSITQGTIENFAPGDYTAFTVIMWIEGNDKDCDDTILGGQFKVDMEINVVSNEEEGNLEFSTQP